MSKLLRTIQLPIIDLEYQRNIVTEVAKIELYDTHLIRLLKFTADETDRDSAEGLPESSWTWKEGVKNFYVTTYSRSEIVGTEIARLETCFHLKILLNSNRSLDIYSKKLNLLQAINETLTDYILGHDEKVIPNIKDVLRTEQE